MVVVVVAVVLFVVEAGEIPLKNRRGKDRVSAGYDDRSRERLLASLHFC